MAKVTLKELGLGADDLAAIGKLSEKGMTPEQIADALEQAHLSKDAIEKISGLQSTDIEIDDAVQNIFKYVFLTQAEYDAITPISTTTYFITEV